MFLRLAKSLKISFGSELSFRSFSKKGKTPKGKEIKDSKPDEPDIEFDIGSLQKDLDSSVKLFENSLQKISIGRGDPKILDKIYIQSLHTELSSLAQVVPRSANDLLVKPFDSSNVEAILTALNSSDMRFQYRREGTSAIQVIIPKATQEYKAQLVKQAKDYFEETKQNIRKKRQNSLNSLKDTKEIGEDDIKRLKNDVQKMTDRYTEILEKMLKEKEKSLNS